MKDSLPEIEEFGKNELLKLERDLLGFYLTEHPLSPVLSILSAEVSHKIYELSPETVEFSPRVKIGGIVSSVRIVLTRNKAQEMAFVTVEDETGKVNAVVFPQIFATHRSCWQKDQVVLLDGRLDAREDNISLIVEKVSSLSSGPSYDFVVKVPAGTRPKILMKLNKILRENPGEQKGVLVFKNKSGPGKKLALSFGVDYSKKVRKEIKKFLTP